MIRLEQITDNIATRIALSTIQRAKQDWYNLVGRNAEDKEYDELRASFKHDCRLYCDIIDLLQLKLDTKEENQGTYYNMQQLLKQLEEDRINGVVREVPDAIL